MAIKVKNTGDFSKTINFLKADREHKILSVLSKYGQIGVEALQETTPKDTGLTAASWSYEVKREKNGYSLSWANSNKSDGIPIVVLLYYGHATGNGYYIEGRDFITPAIQPIFDQLVDDAWKEMNK